MGTPTRYNVWSGTSNLPGLLGWTKAKRNTSLLSSVETWYDPQPAVQPLNGARFALQPLCDAHEAAVTPDPPTRNHLLLLYHPIYSYSITLHPPSPIHLQTSWPAAPQHTAASPGALSVMRKAHSLKQPRLHLVQHLIRFKSLESQVEIPSLSHMLRSWGMEFSRTRVFCLPLKEAALPLM